MGTQDSSSHSQGHTMTKHPWRRQCHTLGHKDAALLRTSASGHTRSTSSLHLGAVAQSPTMSPSRQAVTDSALSVTCADSAQSGTGVHSHTSFPELLHPQLGRGPIPTGNPQTPCEDQSSGSQLLRRKGEPGCAGRCAARGWGVYSALFLNFPCRDLGWAGWGGWS